MHLYSAPLSLFARKVEIALAEKGLSFERVMVPFSQATGYAPKHPEVLAANPKGQVPVLVDGGLTLYDSTVIIEYLDEAYPAPSLFPKTPAARAHCRQIELEADEVLLVPVRALMHRTEPPGPDKARRQQQEAEAMKAEVSILSHYGALDSRLADRNYLCGVFTAADIATFMVIHYALRLGGPPFGALRNIARWYDRLAARPAFAAIVTEIAAADSELSHPVIRP
jgi:glutathione S-transferase